MTGGRISVLGVGNLLRTDEGVGVHAVRALAARLEAEYPDVQFLDGGTLGLNLLMWIEESDAVLLLDAVDCALPAGTVMEWTGAEIPFGAAIRLSQHQVTLQEVLGLARVRARLPERLHLIGMQPASLEIGETLSPTAAGALPEMLDRAEKILRVWQRTAA
jgi:hydrogenase maturation protease